MVPYIRQQAAANGVDPNLAVQIASTEGLRTFLGDRGKSGGAFQLYTGGGMGNTFQQETGLDPLDPRNERATIDYALKYIGQTGDLTPWHGATRAGLQFRGAGGGGSTQGGSGGNPLSEAPPPMQQAGMQVARQTASTIPQPMWGSLGLPQLAQQIDKIAPGANPTIKFMALQQAATLLAPMQREQLQIMMQQHTEDFQAAMQDRRQQFDLQMEKTRVGDRAQQAGQLVQDAQGNWVSIRGSQATPVTQGGQPVSGPLTRPGSPNTGQRTSRNIEVTDPDGKVIFTGAAHKDTSGEWASDKDNKPIEVPDGGSIRLMSGEGQGRQAQTAIQRLMIAGNEIPRAMKNLVDLPITATTGIFAGLGQEKPADLGDAVKRTLANKMTSEDAQSVLVSFQGISRSIASLEAAGAAQGLVGLTARADVLMPREGDTAGTVLRKYAEIRQLMEQSIETIKTSPNIAPPQVKLLDQMLGQIKEAVPWTVPEVNKLQTNPDAQTVRAFAASQGVGEGAAPGAGGGMPTATGPDGKKVQWNGTAWVPVGSQ